MAWSVCVFVCVLGAPMSPAKMAERIEMPFGTWTQVGPVNHVLNGGPDHTMGRGTVGA